MSELQISLYEPEDTRNWPQHVADVLGANAFRVQARGQYRLDAWQPAATVRVRPGLFRIDGFQFDSAWFSSTRPAVRIHPRRFYFETQEAQEPLSQPEYRLVDTSKVRPAPAARLLESLVDTSQTLTNGGVLQRIHISPDSVRTGLVQRTKGIGRDGACFELDADLWRNLARTKVFSVPERLNIMLIYDDSMDDNVVQTYRRMLEREWLPELGVAVGDRTIRPAHLSSVLPAIKHVQSGTRKGNFEDAVFLVALDGKPGDPLPEDQAEFLSVLDQMNLPYRCFSAENRQPKWSARAQAVSILDGAGGISYKLSLPTTQIPDDALIFGIDIGHDTKSRRISHVVVSAVDASGRHIVSLRKHEALNESLAADLIASMLQRARIAAEQRIGRPASAAIIYRDGLIPAKGSRKSSSAESPEVYAKALDLPVTIVELRKRHNPIVYHATGAGYEPVAAGTSCAPAESEVRFLTAYTSLVGLPRVFKLRVIPGFDELEIGIEDAAVLTVGLCYSPSLGLKSHLPGPICWADGIASTRAHSYKFAGQTVIDV
ncbi:MAG: hypothetical protein RQ729_03850 [Wenzhouxiangellaceae bacterium]|nr:hypothetical protein [Wenzhouxiangellaceae bacterium]